ncbi:MAG: glycosyltransferase family 2 protein [Limnochordaceae bacterium]|nr:glycosyltransferase family 2 protein [Limnochordaceae bacterium]
MAKAEVSVVVPYYDGDRFITRAIRSIQNQSCRPLEIIVVDDGSHAGHEYTGAETLGEGGVPVRVVRDGENRGIAAARNSGIRAARGRWIACLDQDDEWVPWKLEHQLRMLAQLGEGYGVFGSVRAPWGVSPSGLQLAAVRRVQRPRELAEALLRWGNFV